MRKRNNRIEVKLSYEEYEDFRKKVAKVGTTKSNYIRSLIMDKTLIEKAEDRFYDILDELLKIQNYLNQIANKAELLELENKDYYRNEAKKWNEFCMEIRRRYL